MYIHVKLMCCHYHFITGSGGYQDRATTKVRLISDPSRNSQLLSPHYFLLSVLDRCDREHVLTGMNL